MRLADGEPADATDQSHVSVVMSSAFPTLLGIGSRRSGEANPPSTSPPPVPPRGPIECPYCGCLVVDDAKLLGQSILCPKCHANFNAPDSEADNKRAAARGVSGLHIVFAAAMISGGIVCPGNRPKPRPESPDVRSRHRRRRAHLSTSLGGRIPAKPVVIVGLRTAWRGSCWKAPSATVRRKFKSVPRTSVDAGIDDRDWLGKQPALPKGS